MKIELKKIKVKDLVENYVSDEEKGVYAYGGKLNIRPAYQREFVYLDAPRNKVIDTVRKGFPLNVMYWVVNKSEDNSSKENNDNFFEFEILDGQQRTISICEFVCNNFSIVDTDGNNKYFDNLTPDQRENILEYELMVYFCEGLNSEKLDWFKTINIAGEKLTDQELLNAIYTGPWLTDAKLKFSKNNCPAYAIGKKYLKGKPIRQEYLETVLKWISTDRISEYMAQHQYAENANELWTFFESTIKWINANFTNYRKEMEGLPWGEYYLNNKDIILDPEYIEKRTSELMADDEVTKKSGIYAYLLTGREYHLSIRAFDSKIKRELFELQKGICANTSCKKECKDISEMEADHRIPWSKGGRSTKDNCILLCKKCNSLKSNH